MKRARDLDHLTPSNCCGASCALPRRLGDHDAPFWVISIAGGGAAGEADADADGNADAGAGGDADRDDTAFASAGALSLGDCGTAHPSPIAMTATRTIGSA